MGIKLNKLKLSFNKTEGKWFTQKKLKTCAQ